MPIKKSTGGTVKVQFRIGCAVSIGSIVLPTPIGDIEFHIVKADTPFLLSLSDMDKLGVYFNNIHNILVSPSTKVPLLRRFSLAFLIWWEFSQSFITSSFTSSSCLLTESELRRIHRRFDHPSANRLHDVLQRSGHQDIDRKLIDHLTKFCTYRQKYKGPSSRFKFNLRDSDLQFNHSIIMDVMYIESDQVLHIVDTATNFELQDDFKIFQQSIHRMLFVVVGLMCTSALLTLLKLVLELISPAKSSTKKQPQWLYLSKISPSKLIGLKE